MMKRTVEHPSLSLILEILNDRSVNHSPELDWGSITEAAKQTRLAPLLFSKITSPAMVRHIPHDALAELKKEYFLAEAAALIRIKECRRILEALANRQIHVILLKGIDLSLTVYNSPGLRPMADLDLLVRLQDVEGVKAELLNLGYTNEEDEFWPGSNRLIDIEENFVHQKNGLHVEVHWNLSGAYRRYLPPIDWFWKTRRTLNTAQLPVDQIYGLSPSANFLYLSTHLLKHGGGRPENIIWLYDLHLLVMKFGDELDWQALYQVCEKFKCGAPVLVSINNLQNYFATPIPAQASTLFAKFSKTEYARIIFLRSALPHFNFSNAYWHFVGAGWISRLLYFFAWLFPSVQYMTKKYPQSSGWLLPLAYISRWFHLLGQLFKALRAGYFRNS